MTVILMPPDANLDQGKQRVSLQNRASNPSFSQETCDDHVVLLPMLQSHGNVAYL